MSTTTLKTHKRRITHSKSNQKLAEALQKKQMSEIDSYFTSQQKATQSEKAYELQKFLLSNLPQFENLEVKSGHLRTASNYKTLRGYTEEIINSLAKHNIDIELAEEPIILDLTNTPNLETKFERLKTQLINVNKQGRPPKEVKEEADSLISQFATDNGVRASYDKLIYDTRFSPDSKKSEKAKAELKKIYDKYLAPPEQGKKVSFSKDKIDDLPKLGLFSELDSLLQRESGERGKN